MTSETLNRKLTVLSTYLTDLRPYENISFEGFMHKHYEIERLLELLIMTASDTVFHMLSLKNEPPPISYRTAFLRAGETGIISYDLSRRLALAAGLRNILAHEYEQIDYRILHQSIPAALRDFSQLIGELANK